jgi:hypothetical protein
MTVKVKVLNNKMNHHQFQYIFGLNVLKQSLNTDELNPVGEGGLYFCDIDNLEHHIYIGDFVCIVEIPDDANVISLQLRDAIYYRTDKLILTNKCFRFDNEMDIQQLIQMNPKLKDYLRDPYLQLRD